MEDTRPEGAAEDRIKLRDRDRFAFEAILKEMEFIRTEQFAAIAHVRRLPITATYIVGFSLPIIASIFTLNYSADQITGDDLSHLFAAIQNGGELAAILSLGVAMVCVSLLRIYVGSFKQIFNFGAYIRENLAPRLNVLTETKVELFEWEEWLRRQRARSWFHAGDADLASEPNIMTFYTVVFTLLANFLARTTNFFEDFFLVCSLIIAALLVWSYASFLKVLGGKR